MDKHLACFAVIVGAAFLSSLVYGQPASTESKGPWVTTEVIADRGGQSIDYYMSRVMKSSTSSASNNSPGSPQLPWQKMFPVVTNSMSVGRVTPEEGKDIKYQMAIQPLFIVGYDPVSISWLRTNQKLLKDKKAVGLVVNVRNHSEMEQLQDAVGPGIPLQPTPGDSLSKALNIKHYPFYMDRDGVLR